MTQAAEIATMNDDTNRLEQLEKVIATGLETFVTVGNALLEIRDKRLYKSTHKTFEEYCKQRWEMGKAYVYRIINATEFVENLSPTGDKNIPERQIRPILTLPKEEQADAWEQAVRTAPNGKVTTKHVEAIVETRKPKPVTPQPPPRPAPKVVETPTPKPTPEPIDDTPKLSVVNGVPCADPPDIKKLRDTGKIAYNAVVEVTMPDGEPEPEPDADPIDDAELSLEDWLSGLPLSSVLKNTSLTCFQADATLYRTLEKARKTYAHHARNALAKDKRRPGVKGEYAYRVSQFLRLEHPKDWRCCIAPEHGGCSGTGQVPLIGSCTACKGRGYTIR